MKTIIQITLVFALIGNLTIPQSVLKYSPCCYNEYGQLTLSCGNAHTDSTVIKAPHTCCDPVKIMLRDNPAPQLNNVVAPAVHDNGLQAVTVARVDLICNFALDVRAFCTATTGPPAFTNVLVRHCRLNI